jgi:molybdopterin-biosynthesis enzyme MoeA-like protein
MLEPKFFTLIIGTEILNRRRSDKHFDFVTKALAQKGHKLSGSFIIEDDPALIVDYTRKCAAIALRDGNLLLHQEAKEIIEKQLGEKAHPHPIKMAQLPRGAKLLYNPVNKMPAFSLDERFFFMPGFPEMSHPMVEEILEILIPNKKKYYRHTLTALCKENELQKMLNFLHCQNSILMDGEFLFPLHHMMKHWLLKRFKCILMYLKIKI